jgi:hypothetical protein
MRVISSLTFEPSRLSELPMIRALAETRPRPCLREHHMLQLG